MAIIHCFSPTQKENSLPSIDKKQDQRLISLPGPLPTT